MKVTPIVTAGTPTFQGQSPQAQDARSKAIAAFNGNQQAQSPVQSQNSVAPEELSAIQTPQSNGQSYTDEQTPSEAPVEEVKATEPAKQEDPALSRQFAQLARQERSLRAKVQQQEQAFKAREDALKAREAQLTGQSQIDTSKYISRDQFKQDPLLVLAEAGISYDDITNRILSQQPSDPRMEATINSLKAEIQALKAGVDETKKSYTEQQANAYQSAVKQITNDVKSLVNLEPAFETIKATNSVNDVVELITQTYDKDGILLTVEEAAQQVEDYLVEEAMKLSQLSKIQKRLAQAAGTATTQSTAQQQQAAPQAPKQQQPMKTLTNASSVPRQLSAKERAILAFRGELKS